MIHRQIRTGFPRLKTVCARQAPLLMACVLLQPAWSFGSSYRDKHGNEGTIALESPVVNGTGDIDYRVPYTLTDSIGNKSGEYRITSEMLPGRDSPTSDDFVLSVFVSDDASQNAAELVFRNNCNESPIAPILRLLDCSSDPCIVDKTYDNDEWGCWIIQDQSDIADYPIELLDARAITMLLEPAQLSLLPTGNWADIMENHRTNFVEAKFRVDIDHLGATQSELLTDRIIAQLQVPGSCGNIVPGMCDQDTLLSCTGDSDCDWLARHSPGIAHGALSFLTRHRDLIEDMTTALFTAHLDNWPLDFTFPFGRMPIWLIDPAGGEAHGPGTPCGNTGPDCHELPLHWERVIPSQGPLGIPGCYHDWPLAAYVPTSGNLAKNLGQYVCAQGPPNSSGFVDRPCTDPNDYFVAGTDSGNPLATDVEGNYHNGIHGFIGGSFSPPSTTAGTMVFWVFHTQVSSNLYANWRHAQTRCMPTPIANSPPVCDANGPYTVECQGSTTDVVLDGTGSSDPDGDPLTYLWTTDCPGVGFDDDSSATPTLTVDSVAPCPLICEVSLTVDDGNGATDSCSTTVTVEDTTEPDPTCPPDVTVTCGEPTDPSATGSATAVDDCDSAPGITFNDVVIPTTCPADPIQEVIERTWTATDACGNDGSCQQDITVLKLVLALDIKPGSCPNGFNPNSGGVLPVSLLGTDTFDVFTVDLSTVQISRADCPTDAVPPTRSTFEDAGTPFDGTPCDCHTLTGDGLTDLSLKFKMSDVVAALGLDTMVAGESVELVVSGKLNDGCSFIASDCVSRPGGKP